MLKINKRVITVKFPLFISTALLLIISVFTCAQSQPNIGLPYIYNYGNQSNAREIGQVWTVIRNLYGIVFLGSDKGIYQYDGTNFNFIAVNGYAVRDFAIDTNNTIYVAGTGTFGYLKPNKFGQYLYVSLSDLITDIRVSEVWQVFVVNEAVYFTVNKKYLYKYFKNRLSRVLLPEKYTNFRTSVIDNSVYLIDRNTGIGLFINDKVTNEFYSPEIDFSGVYNVLPYQNNKLLAAVSNNGLYTLDLISGQFVKFKTNYDSFFKSGRIYTSRKINNSTYAFGSLTNGLLVIDSSGKAQLQLNRATGLKSNGIYKIYTDSEGITWLGTEKGLSKVLLNEDFSFFNEYNNLIYNALDFIYFRNTIYVGSSGGLHYLKEQNTGNLRYTVENLSNEYLYGSGFCLIPDTKSGDTLLIATSLYDIVQISDHRTVHPIAKLKAGLQISKHPVFDNLLVISSEQGLVLAEYTVVNKKVVIDKLLYVALVNTPVQSMQIDSYGNIWLYSFTEGVRCISFTKGMPYTEYRLHTYSSNQGVPSTKNLKLNKVGNDIKILDEDEIYSINYEPQNPEKAHFMPFEFDNLEKGVKLLNLCKLSDNSYFVLSDKSILFIDKSGTITTINSDLLSIFSDSKVFMQNDSTFWIYSLDAFVRYQYQRNKPYVTSKYGVVIFSAGINGKYEYNFLPGLHQSIKSGEQSVQLSEKIPYSKNQIRFQFGSLVFRNESNVLYRYKLHGFDKEWSDWKTEKHKDYLNLPPRKYIFMVQAKYNKGEISAPAQCEIVVSRPWFISFYAYAGYFLIAVLLFYVLIRFRFRQLRIRNQLLEELINKRTAELVMQKEEIVVQSERLASQSDGLMMVNSELEQMSLVIQQTDNSVAILDKRGNFEWWNKAFTKLFEHRFALFAELSFKDMQSKLRPDLYEHIRNYKLADGTITYTSVDPVSENNSIWFQTTITPVFNKNDELYRFVVIDINITQIKKAEREIQEQHAQIEQQRDHILKQTNDILDSILYAKRIQEALLPPVLLIEGVLPDSFIAFIPRDLVSGDFYWLYHNEDTTIFAVADCTGHGIPGAFMSMLGITLLKEIVSRMENYVASEILNLLSSRVIAMLHQRGKSGEANDGMDICICVYSENQDFIQYSGANNPLYLIRRNNLDNSELIEYKPDKMPIGIYMNEVKEFTNTLVPFQKSDTIYLFSDGFVDQFGGAENKKFFTKRFKNILLEIQHLDMYEQKSFLEKQFYDWKGDNEQVDDVLIMGVRL